MVQAATYQTDADIESPVDDCYYQIDLDRVEASSNLTFILWQRLCWEGSCSQCKDKKGRPKPVVPSAKSTRRTLITALNKCSRQPNYILPQMSVCEVVFRLLLGNRNEPMRLSDIFSEMQKKWASVWPQKSITPASVQQMLDSENGYHIYRVEPPGE